MGAHEPVETRYARVREAVATTAGDLGRDPASVQILAVSKRQSVDSIRALAAAGQRAFGENQVQEGLTKMATLTGCDLEWHCIGPLQSNKTRAVAEHFQWLHSLDRRKLVDRLSDQRPTTLPPLNVCIQVHIGDEQRKSGAQPDAAGELARYAAEATGLRLRGLMAIPPPETDYDRQRAHFRQLRVLFDTLRDDGLAMDTLSMGMSGDWRAALAEGATMLRIGTALFGPRS